MDAVLWLVGLVALSVAARLGRCVFNLHRRAKELTREGERYDERGALASERSLFFEAYNLYGRARNCHGSAALHYLDSALPCLGALACLVVAGIAFVVAFS